MSRLDGRKHGDMREVRIEAGVNPYAEGSALVWFGNTNVLVTASVEPEAPRWIQDENMGWVTAEYGMLPRSTHTRCRREAAAGKQGGRTLEIQRLIGRALRGAVDLNTLGPITVRIDCDVLVADGGTRTASISGGWVALRQALQSAHKQGMIPSPVEVHPITAVSAGVVGGSPMLDLCYEEDSSADFDLNLVFANEKELIEIQGTAEKGTIPVEVLSSLIELGMSGGETIAVAQQEALSQAGL